MTDTTTTEVATQESVAPAEVEYIEQREYGSDDLLEFSRNMAITYGFALSLVKTPFVPQQYQGNAGNAAAAIMAARGVGITDPMAALRAFDIIQGTPAMRAVALRALVQRTGHEIWVEESTSQRAVVKGRRAGSANVETSTWDMDRARTMKLTSKDNWQKQPQAMLLARATSEVARLIAADVIMGLYSAEELSDGSVVETVVETEKAKPKRTTIARKKPAQALKEQELAEDVAAAEQKQIDDIEAADHQAEAVRLESEPAPEEGTESPQDDATPMVLLAPGEVSEPFTGDPLQPTQEERDEWAQMPEGFN